LVWEEISELAHSSDVRFNPPNGYHLDMASSGSRADMAAEDRYRMAGHEHLPD